jgi:hypothetical protein
MEYEVVDARFSCQEIAVLRKIKAWEGAARKYSRDDKGVRLRTNQASHARHLSQGNNRASLDSYPICL